jgi:hypothetical protein
LAQRPASAELDDGVARHDDFDIVAQVTKAELVALGDRVRGAVCVHLNEPGSGGPDAAVRAQRPLRDYLRRQRLRVKDVTACSAVGRPNPHAIFMDTKLSGEDGGRAAVVDTNDPYLRPGDSFAESLRYGTYSLRPAEDGAWRIVSYKKKYDFRDYEPAQAGRGEH